jgi:hypothetical protein
MSILDDEPLVTHKAPKTYGDQLPGRFPNYKDGVEEKWTRTEAKAIRGLAAGYHPETVARQLHLRPKTIKGWMGNPHFMTEVQKLTDHYVFKYRAKVLETVALRAIAGSPQHAKLYLMLTRDLKDGTEVRAAHIHARSSDGLDDLNPDQLDDALERELELMGETPGDAAERISRS